MLEIMKYDDDMGLFIYLYHGCVNGLLMLYIILHLHINSQILYRNFETVYIIGLFLMIYEYYSIKSRSEYYNY